MYKLITVRDYSKAHGISEQATRKRISTKLLSSCQLDSLTYVAVEDEALQTIKDLKSKIKLLQSNIKGFRATAAVATKQDEEIQYLRNRVLGLEEDLRATSARLNSSTDKKEELYEKVFTTLLIEK